MLAYSLYQTQLAVLEANAVREQEGVLDQDSPNQRDTHVFVIHCILKGKKKRSKNFVFWLWKYRCGFPFKAGMLEDDLPFGKKQEQRPWISIFSNFPKKSWLSWNLSSCHFNFALPRHPAQHTTPPGPEFLFSPVTIHAPQGKPCKLICPSLLFRISGASTLFPYSHCPSVQGWWALGRTSSTHNGQLCM